MNGNEHTEQERELPVQFTVLGRVFVELFPEPKSPWEVFENGDRRK